MSRVLVRALVAILLAAPPAGTAVAASLSVFLRDSAIVGDTFRIYVALPDGYEHGSGTRYAMVYLLDGDWHFDPLVSIASRNTGVVALAEDLAAAGSMPPVIVVGIGYETADEIGEKRGRDMHHGRGDFLGFLRDELIPLMESVYPADTEFGRTLMGHSSAGWFTTWEFLRYPYGAFDHYVALSGNYEYDAPDPLIYDMEAAMWGRLMVDPVCGATLYVGVGEQEEPRFTGPHATFSALLDGRRYEEFRFTHEVLTGLDHGTVVLPGFEAGLRWVFANGALAAATGAEPLEPVRIDRVAPNPFNPRTTISYAVPTAGPVRLGVYDLRGRLVRILVDQVLEPGDHVATWDGRDRRGQTAAGGTYVLGLDAAGRFTGQRVVLLP